MNKILIVTDFYEPHVSGIVTYINQTIDIYKKKKCTVTVLTTLHKKSLQQEEYINGVNIIRCKPFIKISRGFYSVELVKKYFNLEKKFDTVIIHFPLTEIFPLLFIKNSKTYLTYHCLPTSFISDKLVSIYFYFFGILSFLFVKKIIVLSKDYFVNFFLHRFFEHKLIEIPPFIKKNKNIKKYKRNDLITIGYLGRICKEKGLENIIKASDVLNRKKINHIIKIGGDTNDKRFKKYINKLISRSKKNKNIIFLGKLDEKEKKQFFESIDLFVLPSTNSFEAFGIVQLEAMNYGIPVLASNMKGVRSIIYKTQNGLLFEKNNYLDLANKIIIMKNFDSKNAQQISNDANNYYGYNIFINNIKNKLNL